MDRLGFVVHLMPVLMIQNMLWLFLHGDLGFSDPDHVVVIFGALGFADLEHTVFFLGDL